MKFVVEFQILKLSLVAIVHDFIKFATDDFGTLQSIVHLALYNLIWFKKQNYGF